MHPQTYLPIQLEFLFLARVGGVDRRHLQTGGPPTAALASRACLLSKVTKLVTTQRHQPKMLSNVFEVTEMLKQANHIQEVGDDGGGYRFLL